MQLVLLCVLGVALLIVIVSVNYDGGYACNCVELLLRVPLCFLFVICFPCSSCSCRRKTSVFSCSLCWWSFCFIPSTRLDSVAVGVVAFAN